MEIQAQRLTSPLGERTPPSRASSPAIMNLSSGPVVPGLKGDDGDLESGEVLLMHHVAVHRQQNVEALFGSREQDTVLEAGPADERHRLNRVAGDVPQEPPIQVFVQQDVHSGWLQ